MTPHGCWDASLDEGQIRRWWTRHPDANIGVQTGKESGIWVIDVDAKRSVRLANGALIPEGEDSLRAVEQQMGVKIPETLTAYTGSGGMHLVFEYPFDGHTYGNRGGLFPSIDVRGDGGYIIVEPSIHPVSGKQYKWADESQPIAKAPVGLLSFQLGQVDKPFEIEEEVVEGGRNDYLYRYACALRGEGRDQNDLMQMTMNHNLVHCNPPLDEGEVLTVVANAMRHSPNPQEAKFVWEDPEEVEDIPELDEGDDIAISITDLLTMDLPPIVPLIGGGLMDQGDAVILGGPSGVGKSWLAMSMAIAIARGEKFLNTFETTQGGVLFIDEEGNIRTMKQRMVQLFEGQGISGLGLPIYMAVQRGIKLDSPKGRVVLQRLMERYKPALVIMDTMVRMHNGDENSNQDMSALFEVANRIRHTYDATTMFLHHTRKPSKEDAGDLVDLLRGAGDIRGWPDTVIMAVGTKDAMVPGMLINHGKSRNHRALPDFRVQMFINKRLAKLGILRDDVPKLGPYINEQQESLFEEDYDVDE
jgi:hypothetical protein